MSWKREKKNGLLTYGQADTQVPRNSVRERGEPNIDDLVSILAQPLYLWAVSWLYMMWQEVYSLHLAFLLNLLLSGPYARACAATLSTVFSPLCQQKGYIPHFLRSQIILNLTKSIKKMLVL